MTTTIDAAGRLVIPRAVRMAAGLEPGMKVSVRWNGSRIEIEPEPIPVELVQEGYFLVAVPVDPVAPLSADLIEETRQALRRERLAELC